MYIIQSKSICAHNDKRAIAIKSVFRMYIYRMCKIYPCFFLVHMQTSSTANSNTPHLFYTHPFDSASMHTLFETILLLAVPPILSPIDFRRSLAVCEPKNYVAHLQYVHCIVCNNICMHDTTITQFFLSMRTENRMRMLALSISI